MLLLSPWSNGYLVLHGGNLTHNLFTLQGEMIDLLFTYSMHFACVRCGVVNSTNWVDQRNQTRDKKVLPLLSHHLSWGVNDKSCGSSKVNDWTSPIIMSSVSDGTTRSQPSGRWLCFNNKCCNRPFLASNGDPGLLNVLFHTALNRWQVYGWVIRVVIHTSGTWLQSLRVPVCVCASAFSG